MMLVFVPTKWRVYRDLVEPLDGAELARWQISDLNESLAAWCAAEKIDYIDLTAELIDVASSGEQVYFLDDAHWTSAGHAAAAAAISRATRRADP